MSIGSVIANHTVVDHVRASIGSELDIGRAVEAAASINLMEAEAKVMPKFPFIGLIILERVKGIEPSS
jgi:hypothetical protein